MRAYIIKRLLLMLPTVFLVSLIIFFSTRLVPGTIIDKIVGESGDVELDTAMIERELGLDAPLHTQYGRWDSSTEQQMATNRELPGKYTPAELCRLVRLD